ncbi:hypothetical protein KDL45_18580, partial [bacterium]|nr:hypothetical protein [bacterium]
MKPIFTLVAILLLSFSLLACGDDDETNNPDNANASANETADNDLGYDEVTEPSAVDFNGLGWPIDALINERGELVVLYTSDPFSNDERSALVWFDDTLKPIRQFASDMRFPHTMDANGHEILISDSQNERLLFVDEQTLETQVVDFEDWDLPNVWPNDADFTHDGN